MTPWVACRLCGYPVDAARGVHDVCQEERAMREAAERLAAVIIDDDRVFEAANRSDDPDALYVAVDEAMQRIIATREREAAGGAD